MSNLSMNGVTGYCQVLTLSTGAYNFEEIAAKTLLS